MWECYFCGNTNDTAALQCRSCGAGALKSKYRQEDDSLFRARAGQLGTGNPNIAIGMSALGLDGDDLSPLCPAANPGDHDWLDTDALYDDRGNIIPERPRPLPSHPNKKKQSWWDRLIFGKRIEPDDGWIVYSIK